MTAVKEQVAKQMTKAWSSASWPTFVTLGHLVTCLFNTTYRAKYYLTKGWSSALVICPSKWSSARPYRGSWPDGHVTREVVK